MAHFHVYGDESGKLGKSEYTSFCGYVGSASEWQRVSVEWNDCRLRWGVPPIHMRAIVCPDRDPEGWLKIQKQYGSQWEETRSRILREFSLIIQRASVACIGAVVDSGHFDAMRDSKFKQEAKNPHYLAFHELVMAAIEKTEKIGFTESISIVLDDDQEYSVECYKILESLKATFATIRERIVGICFVNDVAYAPIQAADMVAFESRRLMVERKSAPDTPPSDILRALTMGLYHMPKFYNASTLDGLEKTVV